MKLTTAGTGLVAAAVTAVLLATVPVTPEAAGAEAAAKPGPTKLVLTVSPAKPAVPVTTQAATAQVVLTCEPAGGTHPRAVAACRQLTAVDGRFARLKGRPGTFCTREYNPVTATATGTWRGRPAHYRKTFGNRCELHAATGAVFRF